MGLTTPNDINREEKSIVRKFKRVLSCLLVLAMLASVSVMTSAEEVEVSVFGDEILNSITVEEDTGLGLAFLIKMNVKGAQVDGYNKFVNDNATVTMGGEEYAVVKMGAVMANQAADIANIDNLTLENVDGSEGHVLDVTAKYLYAEPEAYSCQFAVRIVNLPTDALGRAIACRPYIVLEKDGVKTTIYGANGDISTYNSVCYASASEETPVLDVDNLKNAVITEARLSISDASAAYAAYDPATYVEAFKVNFTLENISANAISSNGDYVTYVCKDAEGNELSTVKVAVDVMNPGETKDVELYVPVGTAIIEASELNLNYVPDITLPAIGSDIDVTKKKNRIRISAAEASFNEDGTIHVALTFKNYTSNWITEETDYVQYTYYKANGTKIKTVTLYIGVIDTKKNPVKTFEFDLPATAASVKITKSDITYWTEWA